MGIQNPILLLDRGARARYRLDLLEWQDMDREIARLDRQINEIDYFPRMSMDSLITLMSQIALPRPIAQPESDEHGFKRRAEAVQIIKTQILTCKRRKHQLDTLLIRHTAPHYRAECHLLTTKIFTTFPREIRDVIYAHLLSKPQYLSDAALQAGKMCFQTLHPYRTADSACCRKHPCDVSPLSYLMPEYMHAGVLREIVYLSQDVHREDWEHWAGGSFRAENKSVALLTTTIPHLGHIERWFPCITIKIPIEDLLMQFGLFKSPFKHPSKLVRLRDLITEMVLEIPHREGRSYTIDIVERYWTPVKPTRGVYVWLVRDAAGVLRDRERGVERGEGMGRIRVRWQELRERWDGEVPGGTTCHLRFIGLSSRLYEWNSAEYDFGEVEPREQDVEIVARAREHISDWARRQLIYWFSRQKDVAKLEEAVFEDEPEWQLETGGDRERDGARDGDE